MIRLHQISQYYETRNGHHCVLNGIDLTINPGEKLGILGMNGSGKSTLIRIISGAERPTRGQVHRHMSVSWPLGFHTGFQGSLTGLDNLKFICRVYNQDYRDKVDFVEDFAELGKFFREPVKYYSSGMAARLAFSISMAVDFDCFLIDETIAVGDARFTEKCQHELFEKRKDHTFIIASHMAHIIHQHCDQAVVLVDGKLYPFEDVDTAYNFYQESLCL